MSVSPCLNQRESPSEVNVFLWTNRTSIETVNYATRLLLLLSKVGAVLYCEARRLIQPLTLYAFSKATICPGRYVHLHAITKFLQLPLFFKAGRCNTKADTLKEDILTVLPPWGLKQLTLSRDQSSQSVENIISFPDKVILWFRPPFCDCRISLHSKLSYACQSFFKRDEKGVDDLCSPVRIQNPEGMRIAPGAQAYTSYRLYQSPFRQNPNSERYEWTKNMAKSAWQS